MSSAHDYVNAHIAHFQEQLLDLIRIPSISTSPNHVGEVRRAAEWLAADLEHAGMMVEICPTPGHPVVYAEWLKAGPSAPTVLIYGHYDVQPASLADGWAHDPFDPQVRDGFIHARGASDDKGQVFAHVKAAEAMLANGGAPVNLKLLIEGEEEAGSVNLAAFVRANQERLKADVCLISDSGIPMPDQPAVVYALRGLVAFELQVFGPAVDLHSGSYGGSVHNAAQAIAEIIARLHDTDGRVAVPGFYDDVLPMSAEERAQLAAAGLNEAEWRRTTGAPQPWGESDFTIAERVGARPTLEVNGIAGGFFEPGFKTVLPARAWAKLSCRLVANQDPHKIAQLIADYIQHITPPTVRSELTLRDGSPPAFVDINAPAMQCAIEAYERAWGRRPVFMREGGSIPVVADFQKVLGLPVILMGIGLNDDGAHSPKERFSLELFHKGIHASIYFCESLARQHAQGA